MQGIKEFIPTHEKIEYLSLLLKVGFDTLDFGSFVNPKAIPQLSDTQEVLQAVQKQKGTTKLLAIVANERGFRSAINEDGVDIIGFPYSLSEMFQQRNTNRGKSDALSLIQSMVDECTSTNKELRVYLGMAFGNPYEEEYSEKLVFEELIKLQESGVEKVLLADTIGVADEALLSSVLKACKPLKQALTIGVHLHSTPEKQLSKLRTVLREGYTHIEGALLGYGGCPMAKDDLTGNVDTLAILQAAQEEGIETGIDYGALQKAVSAAQSLFARYH